MSTDHKIALIAVTSNGLELAKRLQVGLGRGDLFTTAKLKESREYSRMELECGKLYEITPSLGELTGELFRTYNTLIFIMAAGIVVRMIAPYLQDKLKDPAVLVVDEMGQNVISLLSGHMGGANQMTLKVSKLIDAHPVITTSTDVNEKAALDNIAKLLNASIENFRETVKDINYRLVHDEKIGLYQEYDYKIDSRGFTLIKDLKSIVNTQGTTGSESIEKVVCITYKKNLECEPHKIIKVIPRDLVIGIGCRKDTPKELLEESLNELLETYNIDSKAIKCVASVDVKEDETAIIALADKLGVPFQIVPREEIVEIEELFDRSEFVKKNIGVYSVAEPVAYLLSGGNLWIRKHKYKGITFAIGRVQR
ncbi:MAG: cobalamin biosynthesis protein CbiG [Clostridia bacterium]|nr:cobalamin biosynthesis protein CbiG [Clostridia bacterium]